MTYAYEAVFEHMRDDTGDYWRVEFPQLEGALTYGWTIGEACRNAAEVLTLTIADYLDDGCELPEPTFHEPPLSVVAVDVDGDVVERTKLLDVAQAAEELEIAPDEVVRLLDAGGLEAREFHGERMATVESVSRHRREACGML